MNNKNAAEEEIFEKFEPESSAGNKEYLNKIIYKEKKIIDKTKILDLNRFKKMLNQIRLTISLIKDFKSRKYTEIPWRSVAMIAAAVMYFVNPFDVVPDLMPVFGFTDDALLFAAVFKSIQEDLLKYCQWKGLDQEKYF